MTLAKTPPPPYWAVIFSSHREANAGDDGYGEMAEAMDALAKTQPGYLGIESARDAGAGITVSYWRSPEDIAAWKKNLDHLEAQRSGRARWYSHYEVRICEVKRAYGFERASPHADELK